MASFEVPDSFELLHGFGFDDTFDDAFDDVFDDNNSNNEATKEYMPINETIMNNSNETIMSTLSHRQHLAYQNECKIGNTWYPFKHIKGVQLNNELELMFSLEWELCNFIVDNSLINKFHTILLKAEQLEHHYKTKDWIHRFHIWCQHESVVIGKLYTWEDLYICFKLDKDVQDWLKENDLGRFIQIFNEQECFTMNNLSMLTSTVMEQWGLDDIIIRYILKCINDLKQ